VILMATTSPTPVLPDDHIDLLISAAAAWHILASRTAAAFAQSVLEQHVLIATATEAGRLLRAENAAAVQWLSDHGRTRLVDRHPPQPYTHRRIEHLAPVEVLKAAQAACATSPTWNGSPTARLLEALLTAASHRLPGYADAPWSWTRPQRRTGRCIGVALPGSPCPPIPGLTWTSPEQLRDHWTDAPLIVICCAAAAAVPPDLPARSGVFVLAVDEAPDDVWQAVTSLDMPALVLMWPTCQPWLQEQLRDPAPEFVEHRSQP